MLRVRHDPATGVYGCASSIRTPLGMRLSHKGYAR